MSSGYYNDDSVYSNPWGQESNGEAKVAGGQNFGSGSQPWGQDDHGDVKSAVERNLASVLGNSNEIQPETTSRGIGSLISGIAGSMQVDESKVESAHERAYNQGEAGAMSDSELGAAAAKEVFDKLFSSRSRSGNDESVGEHGLPDATDVASLFASGGSTAGEGRDRGFGTDMMSSFMGGGTQAPVKQKGAFEKVVDMISKEVAKVGPLRISVDTL